MLLQSRCSALACVSGGSEGSALYITGLGKIKSRDNAALWGTDAECKLRQPDDPFYKKFAAECSRVQIAVDIFAMGCASSPTSLLTSRGCLKDAQGLAHLSTIYMSAMSRTDALVCMTLSLRKLECVGPSSLMYKRSLQMQAVRVKVQL